VERDEICGAGQEAEDSLRLTDILALSYICVPRGSRLNPRAPVRDQRKYGNFRRPLSRTNVREHEGDDPADAALIERDADSLVAAPDRVAAPNKLIGFD
jgi:hypothetical protein